MINRTELRFWRSRTYIVPTGQRGCSIPEDTLTKIIPGLQWPTQVIPGMPPDAPLANDMAGSETKETNAGWQSVVFFTVCVGLLVVLGPFVPIVL